MKKLNILINALQIVNPSLAKGTTFWYFCCFGKESVFESILLRSTS